MSEPKPKSQGMSADDQKWLIERLAELIEVCGHERFVGAPIVGPEDEHFPDRSRRDAAGVQVLARRLLWHCGLTEHRARVTDLRGYHVPSTVRMLSDTNVWFVGIKGHVAEFELTEIGNDDLVGILCHEVGVAYRDFMGVDRVDAGHPFRDPWLQERHHGHEDEHMVAVLGSLTTVYLGLGLLATNASHHARHSALQEESSQWSITTAGGLPSEVMSFLCALHAVVRDERAGYDGLLRNQRADFDRWYKRLAGARDSLIDRLGLPASDSWTALDTPVAESFDDEHYDDSGALAEHERGKFNTGKPVFRTPIKNTLAVILAMLVSAPLLVMVGWAALNSFIPGALVAVGVCGAMLYNHQKTPAFRCSDQHCRALLEDADEHCPRCGGDVVGLLQHPSDRLNALEAYEAKLLTEGDASRDAAEMPSEE